MHGKLSLTTTTSNPLVPLDPPSSLAIPAVSGSNNLNYPTRRPSQMYANFYDEPSSERRFYYISVKLVFRWLLLLWLASGVLIYLVNGIQHDHTTVRLLGMAAWVVFCVAIANHLLLLGSVYFNFGPVLVGCTIFQCALMVAVPALIVDVVPSLLTYAYLLLSIVMLLCYGVLYMRSSTPGQRERHGGRYEEDNSRGASSSGRKTSCITQSSPAGATRHQSIAPESFSNDSPSRSQHLVEVGQPLHRSNFSSSTSPLAVPRGSCQF